LVWTEAHTRKEEGGCTAKTVALQTEVEFPSGKNAPKLRDGEDAVISLVLKEDMKGGGGLFPIANSPT